MEKPNHWHGRLLCARRERPSRSCTAEQRDELAPFRLTEFHSMPASTALHNIELAGISQRAR
jgi:hypothetical protein